MPGSDENVIILESDDDDEALSGDKDDVVFVNMTPAGLRPAKIKSYLTPISIDSDDEDEEDDDEDDIIFVSATRGSKSKTGSRRRTLSTTSLPVVTSQEVVLTTLEQSLSASSALNPPQTLPQDVLAPSEHEHSNPLLLTPKLPPGQPNFHDNTNYVDTDSSDVTSALTAVTSATDVVDTSSRMSTVDPPGSLSAFLSDVKPSVDPMVGGSGPNALGPWSDPNSAQQGLLAWLRDLSTPSNVGLNTSDSAKTDNSANSHGNVAGSTNPVTNASPISSSSNPLSSSIPLTSIQTIDNLLSTTSTLPACSPTSPKLSVANNAVSNDATSSSSVPQSASITSLASSLISPSSFLKAFQAGPGDVSGPGACSPMTPDSGGAVGSPKNISPVSLSSTSPIVITPTSLSTSPTSSTTSPSSVQSSGATSSSYSIPIRISTRPVSPPPKPPSALSSSLPSSSNATSSLTPFSSGITDVSDSANTAPQQPRPRSPNSGVIVITPTVQPTRNTPKGSSGDTGSSPTSTPTQQKTPLLKRSASYMHTHPNNIPLKKRRRQRAGQRLSLDSADTRGGSGGGGDTDSRKCSWCQLMVSYSHLSLCMQGHPCCADCLQQRAKALLSKSKRGSLKCPYPSCVSYFPMSQLQRTLPPMVVEILEEKLDQEYINYAADLVWQNLGESSGGGGGGPGGADADGAAMADDDDEDDDDEDGGGMLVGGDRGHAAGLSNRQPTLCPLPVFWEPMEDNSGFKLVELSTENIEYTEICCLFNSTMKNQATIQRILRIQNPILWQFYNVKKLQMGQESGGEAVVEKQLCHGTSNGVVEAICKSNFDWRLCGAHGTMYGQGTYFARDASYSHVYTDNARPRTLHSPGHILAMLNKSKRARNHQICLKHLPSGVSSSGSTSGSGGSGAMWSGAMMTPQPPPAHWKPQNSVGVSVQILPPMTVTTVSTNGTSTTTTLPPPSVTVVSPPSSSSSSSSSSSLSQSQSLRQTSLGVAMTAAVSGSAASAGGPTIGSTSTGNSGLNLSMRPSMSAMMAHSALHKVFCQHHRPHSLPRYTPLQPPPAHQGRRAAAAPQQAGTVGTCGGHSRSSSHYSKRRSTTSSYSNDTSSSASPQPKPPVHSMFIAKVLVGRYTNGHNHYRKPPPVDLSDPYGRAYDSCVDNVHDPKIYVIFDSAQCYPEYLIEYTGNNSSCYI